MQNYACKYKKLSFTLTAVAGSPVASGGLLTNSLVTNQTGTFLFATNGDSRNLTSYSVNPTSGALANIGVQAANTLGTTGVLTGIAYYFPPLAPSAATVSVSGRVTTASGRSISMYQTRNLRAHGNGFRECGIKTVVENAEYFQILESVPRFF